MRQPLMLMPTGIPPAQAEALYDASLEDAQAGRQLSADGCAWPGEDWDDDASAPTALSQGRPQSSPFAVSHRVRVKGH